MHSTENGSESGGDQASTARTTLSVSAGATPVSVSSTPNTLSTNGSASIVRECAGCGKRIVDRFLLKALDLFWHEDCLKCGCCDCRLGEVGSTLYTKANLILCKRDYLRLFGTTGYCAACNKVIPAFEMVMRAKNNVYHLECFACQQCNHRFCVGDRFYLCENKILCEYDYEERLVFANMAYNPSSLAHIRSEKNSDTAPGPQRLPISPNGGGGGYPLGQRPHDGYPPTDGCPLRPSAGAASDCCPITAQRNQATRDDGSSGYGSPDSETFEAQLPMHHQ